MPLYTYQCNACDMDYERIVPISSRDEQECECGAPLHRKIDRPGMVYAPTSSGTATHK